MKTKIKPTTAYFSMEIGLDKKLHTYSGGLGVLAGDTLKSAADLGIPVIGVSLIHRKGYLHQEITKGYQVDFEDPWDVEKYCKKISKSVVVPLFDKTITVTGHIYEIKGVQGHIVPILFLDTSENSDEYFKNLTDRLYGGDQQYRLCQEIVLGIAGTKLLKELGYKIETHHMNEGHASLLTLELLKMEKGSFEQRIENVKKKCVFTTHTPVAAGHDVFPFDMATNALSQLDDNLKDYALTNGSLNTTLLALKSSHFSNAVARKHGFVSKDMFPEHKIHYITNGIHVNTWMHKEIKNLVNEYVPLWESHPESIKEVMAAPNSKVFEAHQKAKSLFINYINKKQDANFNADTFTIGFARRATGYKRSHLLFKDVERLKKISEEKGGLQIVYAGKSHPNDTEGKEHMKRVLETGYNLPGDIKFVYLSEYDMDLAKVMIPGVDIWLNTPLRPKEASGTSGMKAAANAVPSLSILDGWWIEGHMEGITGWAIGTENDSNENQDDNDSLELYRKLDIIVPLYYLKRDEWITVMKSALAINASYFNTNRMVKEYVSRAYFR